MMTPERSEILRLLGPLSDLTPDMRFGQLVANLITLAGGMDAGAIWDMDDDQLIPAIRQMIADFSRRQVALDAEAVGASA
jgi:hypothetical protein